ncbi:hypothetical protein CSC70_00435 [Pseudoxanthomonas kalamensis DSM 18571]|uniref:hypothetical protein n=1 Tax=Pseudoxanthomonas kalamensis TaxID=289483 RepID=UPI001390FAA4|nr:hypothetical protein [Pseudoxanthomonas kalamensis]KAF1712649.1 hypothetical protein CSC70_00435 [Pseudoxanthomonas kalamensis DSM 18571]
MPRLVPHRRHSRHVSSPCPRLTQALCALTLTGLALVAVLPATRGHSEVFGWWPLWLVGMPASAWWALYRFRLPVRRAAAGRLPQARRLVPIRVA